jgi:hypothetical protein
MCFKILKFSVRPSDFVPRNQLYYNYYNYYYYYYYYY